MLNLDLDIICSTEEAIHNFVNRIYLSMDRGEYNMAVFVDLCIAFYSLDRGLAFRILHHFGLRGTILEWYWSYFNGRRQKAKVNQCSSEKKNVSLGTPQGSVLGHLIFIVSNCSVFPYFSDFLLTCSYTLPKLHIIR